MAIETTCSGCGQRLAVADENAGKRARCPACGQIYTIPLPEIGRQDLNPANIAPQLPISFPAGDMRLAETAAGPRFQADQALNPFSDQTQFTSQFWMQTADGNTYGPVDRTNLNRWFNEGRVGPGYQIRQAEGPWQPADVFRPQVMQGGESYSNAYAAPASATYPAMSNYQKSDPSALVLTMGILAWVCLLLCWPISWIPSVIAWISGRAALRDIQTGIADPTNVSLVQVGYYLGMVHVILTGLILLAVIAFFAVALVVS